MDTKSKDPIELVYLVLDVYHDLDEIDTGGQDKHHLHQEG